MAARQRAAPPAGKKAARKRKVEGRTRKGGKGYQRSQEHTPETLPATTMITGSVGSVKNLWSLIDERLKELDLNWTSMAKQLQITRQYIYDCLQRGRMPWSKFRLICGILGWDARDVVTFTFTRPSTGKDTSHDEKG